MNNIQALIWMHAGFGGVALLAGAAALLLTKGSNRHKKAGKIFFYAMLVSALLALVISVLPEHENGFLFAVGVFSTYFILSGYRSLRLKKKKPDLLADRLIAWAIIITGLLMVLYPIFALGKINIVLFVFGVVGLVFGIRDLKNFSAPESLRNKWLKLHLGKMTGGYISATTAFFVVNEILPGIWNWFVPGVLGSFLIAFWIRKVDKKAMVRK